MGRDRGGRCEQAGHRVGLRLGQAVARCRWGSSGPQMRWGTRWRRQSSPSRSSHNRLKPELYNPRLYGPRRCPRA